MMMRGKVKLMNVVWYLLGIFFMGGYENGVMVFWDVKEGRVVGVRDVYGLLDDLEGDRRDRVLLGRVKWVCKGNNLDDIGLVV